MGISPLLIAAFRESRKLSLAHLKIIIRSAFVFWDALQ
jgi:hypothetical protein